MISLSKPKKMQSLIERVAALSRFVSLLDKCSPFFQILNGGKKFEWNNKCEQSF